MSFLRRPFFWALVLRLTLAWTRFGWNHPDEWFQTVEFGSLLAWDLGSSTQEVLLHMRNLSLPTLWALVIKSVHSFTGSAGGTWEWSRTALSVGWIQTISALGDVAACWAWYRLYSQKTVGRIQKQRFAWVLALAGPLVLESFRPSAEHWAAICIPFVLLSLESIPFFAGIFAAALTAMKLSVAPFALGAGLAFLVKKKRILSAVAGLIVGLILFGAADYFGYQSFWQSARMYTHFNLIADLARKNFGAQSAWVYLDFWKGQWPGMMIVFGVLSVPFVVRAFLGGLRRFEPWALGSATFLGVHFIIGHKEPRFMAPLVGVYFFALFLGLNMLSSAKQKSRVLSAIVGGYLIFQVALSVSSIGRDYFRANGVFFEHADHLKTQSALGKTICGVITVRKPMGVLMQDVWWQTQGSMRVALAFMPMGRKQELTSGQPLLWMHEEPKPECLKKEQSIFLVHTHRIQVIDALAKQYEAQCEVLSDRWLRVLPAYFVELFRKKDWLGSVWAQCSAKSLVKWKAQAQSQVRNPFVQSFGSWREAPDLKMTSDQFEAWVHSQIEAAQKVAGHKIHDGTLGDYE